MKYSVCWLNATIITKNIDTLITNTFVLGFIEPLLCWKPVITLSRLTYCAFLCHGGLQLYTVGSIRTPFHASYYNLVGQLPLKLNRPIKFNWKYIILIGMAITRRHHSIVSNSILSNTTLWIANTWFRENLLQ